VFSSSFCLSSSQKDIGNLAERVGSVIPNIHVGDHPIGIAANPNNDMVYVANSESNTVSVIEGKTNDLVVGATFNLNPIDSGQILCDDEKIPTNKYRRIKSGFPCKAITNNGFAFSSWVERNLDSNSSITITESTANPPLSNLLFHNPRDSKFNTFL
jgi:hypothetical protein